MSNREMDNQRPPAADARAAEAFGRGRSAEQQGALDEALAAYREALAGAPRQSEWWYRLGCVQRKQGDLVGAHEAFRQAVDLGGEDSRALTNLGTVLDELGRRAEAMQMYLRAIAADQDNADAHHNLGALYAEEGRPRDAVRCFEAAIRARPDAEGYLNLGMVHFRDDAYDEALACFEQGLKVAPQSSSAIYFTGLALQKKGLYREAADRFRRTLELDGRLVRAHFHLGTCLRKLEKHEESLASLLRALDAFPDDGRLHYQLALTYDALLMRQEARKHYRLARQER